MKNFVTILGSGTSHGVPVIGCHCPVCLSSNPKNHRSRSSLLLSSGSHRLIIDTSTDFRFQALRERLQTLDVILLTHAHADHIHGLDDIRSLCSQGAIPLYGKESVLEEIKKRFNYIFTPTQLGGGKPSIDLHPLTGTLEWESFRITAIPLKHGDLDIYGYRIGSLAYLTDCSYIPESSFSLLQGLDTLILGTLRFRSHPTHFGLGQSLEVIERLKPVRSVLTHMCHIFDHEILEQILPENIKPAWDGMRIAL